MTVSTRSANKEIVVLGLAELYLADSLTNIATTIPILQNSDYIGAQIEVSFEISREFKKNFKIINNIRVLFDELLIQSTLSLSVKFIEIGEKNISYSFGGNKTSANVLSDILIQPKEHRAELVFTYPNKINKMILVLPRIKISTEKVAFSFSAEDILSPPITLSALVTDNVNWSANEYGKILFI